MNTSKTSKEQVTALHETTPERSVDEIVETNQCDAGDVVTGWVIQSDEVRNILQAERQKREKIVEEIYGHFSWCRECGEGPACSEALAIKEKYGITQPNNKKYEQY